LVQSSAKHFLAIVFIQAWIAYPKKDISKFKKKQFKVIAIFLQEALKSFHWVFSFDLH